MARRNPGGSIYVSTNPNVTLAIGTPGEGLSIGLLGPLIFAGASTPPSPGSHILRELGDIISTESGDLFIVE